MYQIKQDGYFGFVRKEIAPLLPKYSPNVLEVGCGEGKTLQWLKDCGRAGKISGIELNLDAAEIAFKHLDKVYGGDANLHLKHIPLETQDMVLCLDVIEHMQDPWETVQRIYDLLRPGGSLILSVPNVRHYSVLLPLLFKDKWNYTEAGIMDKTHLRFFSGKSAMEMLKKSGFTPKGIRSTYVWGNRDKWIDIATLGLLKGFLSFQYLICVEKPLLQKQQDAMPDSSPQKAIACPI